MQTRQMFLKLVLESSSSVGREQRDYLALNVVVLQDELFLIFGLGLEANSLRRVAEVP